MDHMKRFLGTAPVRALSGTPLTVAYSVGQRLKRGGKRKIEYGYMAHPCLRALLPPRAHSGAQRVD